MSVKQIVLFLIYIILSKGCIQHSSHAVNMPFYSHTQTTLADNYLGYVVKAATEALAQQPSKRIGVMQMMRQEKTGIVCFNREGISIGLFDDLYVLYSVLLVVIYPT